MSTENEELELDPIESGEEGGEGHHEEEASARVDSEIEDAVDDTEREEIRARRRNERRSKNAKNRERVEALERNLNAVMEQNRALQQQVGTIQDANVGNQLAQVDNAIQQATNAAEHFKGIIARASAANDGAAVAEATEHMIASRERAKELNNFKLSATRAINAPKPLNPQLVSKSQAFLGKNTWYGGPSSSDPDSKVLTALDNSLTAEGWDPTSDAYWTELDNRAKKYLPHRAAAAPRGETRERQSNPVPGGNRAPTTGDKGGTFTLSPDRVKAIKDAGAWDDITARNGMIKAYRSYDKENGRG